LLFAYVNESIAIAKPKSNRSVITAVALQLQLQLKHDGIVTSMLGVAVLKAGPVRG
jgi:hypothetical protein